MSSPTTDIMIGVQCKISMILKSLRLMITRSGVVSSPEGAIGPNEAYGLALRLGEVSLIVLCTIKPEKNSDSTKPIT
jgi:hypothetical protein